MIVKNFGNLTLYLTLPGTQERFLFCSFYFFYLSWIFKYDIFEIMKEVIKRIT